MKGKFKLLIALAAATPVSAFAQNIDDIVKALKSVECYRADASFTVSMPQLNDDVVYSLTLESSLPADSLAPCSYYIAWTMPHRSDQLSGFSAYFDGHHYRYGGERLQEYHMEWDPVPFMPRKVQGLTGEGVQRTAQFADLLPQFLGEKISGFLSDPHYSYLIHPDTIVGGQKRLVLDVAMTVNDEVCTEIEYVFDRSTLLPVAISTENNLGSISEQTVDVKFTPLEGSCEPITEQRLMGIYPEVFEKFRENNFRIESLPGSRLPGFSLPTTTGEKYSRRTDDDRYSRRTSDGFRAPTILVLIDPSAGFSADLVRDIRAGVDQLPFGADVIWAFASNNVDLIEQIVPQVREGEHLLMNARGLARDCGAASLPVVIMVGKDGVVRDVELGYNKDLSSIVIQKMALMEP